MPEKTKRNRFQDAADECGVPLAEFKLWLVEHAKVTPDRWSKWEHSVEGVPKKYLVAFLKDKIGVKPPRDAAGRQ